MDKNFFSSKRMIALLSFVLLFSAVRAQDNQTKHFEFGCNIGMSDFCNYSAVSLFQDASAYYTTWSESIQLGYLYNNTFLGLHAQFADINTSAIDLNEVASLSGYSLMARKYFTIGHNLEPFIGCKIGLMVINSNFKYLGEDYNHTRLGSFGEFEIGINYKFENDNYIGVNASYIILGRNFNKDISLPTELVGNNKQMFGGYSLTMQYGIRF